MTFLQRLRWVRNWRPPLTKKQRFGILPTTEFWRRPDLPWSIKIFLMFSEGAIFALVFILWDLLGGPQSGIFRYLWPALIGSTLSVVPSGLLERYVRKRLKERAQAMLTTAEELE